ncbi:MAG: four helix bundle protein [Planctomycetota bacterium]|nr:four helix bundle protein [Planctomycetota bacterium]
MPKINRFEELVGWQKAREFSRAIYAQTRKRSFARDFGLAGQIQRAVVSIMSNLAEGFERGKRGEFHQFVSVAKGSCAEVRSHLYVALDIGYLDRRSFDLLLGRAEEIGRILGGLRKSLERQRNDR